MRLALYLAQEVGARLGERQVLLGAVSAGGEGGASLTSSLTSFHYISRYAKEVSKPPQVDYSHEMRLSTNPAVRFLWLVLGLLFTGLGIVGAFLPVMPTTVFLLIAAFFFARSSPKFYNWLLNNRAFGPLIRDWRAGLGLPLRAKVLAVLLIGLTAGSSILFVSILWVQLMLAAVALGVSAYLLTRPTKRTS